eukprot:TRINITY_DN387_c0_g4_i2.p1 TRINITY_DN387_c0_g4~~TRINITY_DN387_c0_g4_i2.p1  ORF type:complete len:138 (+),score=8.90 TRINITY_DN387_c0_g4_i2:131-544(+)
MISLYDSYLSYSVYLIIVGMLWGCTNPLMKRGSKGVSEIRRDSAIKQFFAEFKFLFSRYQYVIPLVINLSGSIVFYYTLGKTDISLVVPITNSLTFLFTTLTSRFLGEEYPTNSTYIGMGLVLLGVSICVQSKLETV